MKTSTKSNRKGSTNQICSKKKPPISKNSKNTHQSVNNLFKKYWSKGLKNTTIIKQKTADLESSLRLKNMPKRKLFAHKQTMCQIEYEGLAKCNTSRPKNEVCFALLFDFEFNFTL